LEIAIHDNRTIGDNINSLLGRGATDDAALIVPDGPTLTYGRCARLPKRRRALSRWARARDRVARVPKARGPSAFPGRVDVTWLPAQPGI
jgi:hypothetical protein